MIVAGTAVGVSTLPELIALAKTKPGELTYAANFRGSLPNMTGEMFASRAGIELTFVPYPGAPPALQDVIGGRVSAHGRGPRQRSSARCMASNSVKPLAITSPSRLPNYPDLPTVGGDASGLSDSRGWIGAPGAQPARRTTWCARSMPTCARCSTSPRCGQRFETLRHLRPPSVAGRDRQLHSCRTGRRGGRWSSNSASRRNDAAILPLKQKGRRRAPLSLIPKPAYFRREIGM